MINIEYNWKITLISIISVTLLSCASTPIIPQNTEQPAPPVLTESNLENQRLLFLLNQSEASPSPQAEEFLFDAAKLLISLNRVTEASDILNQIDLNGLELALATDILLQKAQLLIQANQPEPALEILELPRLDVISQLADSQQASYRLLRSQAYFDNDRHLESAQERIYADKLLSEDLLPQNHELLWTALSAVPVTQLQQLSRTEINYEFQGWYELGVIGSAYQYNLDRQLVELERWQQRWGRHPAANNLPQALQLVETMARERPEQIALLLPLDISAGKIVRDGFMSAYYSVKNIGGQVPKVIFYNTSDANVSALYQQAVSEGAALIVGPLLKQNVAQLQSQTNLAVPTLALNTIEGLQPASNKLFQFALSPEYEAKQVAIRAWRDGHRLVAVLSPSDPLNSDLYTRKRNSFIQEWESLGGIIVAREIFRDNYTEVIETLLDLSDSNYRMEQLSDLIREPLEFTQRRRQDIDFIFLIAQPGAARQINPRLGYLYAGDIPVYATQDIYSGLYRPLEDADLNGIRFSDSPWILADSDELKEETQLLFPQVSASNLRLQAFGIDAFRLYPRLQQLESVPESQVYGASGRLRFGENRNIVRELTWATIENGEALLLE